MYNLSEESFEIFIRYYWGVKIKECERGWTCNVCRRDEKYITNFTWKLGKEAPIQKSGRIRWEDNIIMDLKEI